MTDHNDRKVSLDDIARAFVADLPLADQLDLSVLHARVKALCEAARAPLTDTANALIKIRGNHD